MKVEEIKLAFETNVQFALIDEVKKNAEEVKKVMKRANDYLLSYDRIIKDLKNDANSLEVVRRTMVDNGNIITNVSEDIGVKSPYDKTFLDLEDQSSALILKIKNIIK